MATGLTSRTILLLLTLSLLVCLPASAAAINVPADFPTIQAGIDAAVDGDTVLVADGTYVENIDFLGKAITVESSDGPEVTIIDGSKPEHWEYGSVVYFWTGEKTDSVLRGFTITGGRGTYFMFEPWLGITYIYRIGAGIYCSEASPTITNNIIVSNKIARNNFYFISSSQLLPGVSVNVFQGGGIYCYNANAIISENQIIANEANEGGGLFCFFQADATIANNLIADNIGHVSTAGIHIENSDNVLIVNNRIQSNIPGYASWANGGGVCLHNSPALVAGNEIMNNESNSGGAGLRLINDSPDIRNNIIANNYNSTNQSYGGGGIFLYRCSAAITNNIFYNNSHYFGGGIYARDSVFGLQGNTISSNTAVIGGGGIYLERSSSILVNDTIFFNNSAAQGPQGYLSNVSGASSAVIEYSDIVGGVDSFFLEKGCTLDFIEGAIDADPEFVGGPAGDYYLSQTAAGQPVDSPCVDSGNPQSPLPLGTTRTDEIQDTNIIDMGFHYPAPQWEYICAGPPDIRHQILATDLPVEEQILIWNCGEGLLEWTLTEDADWLSISASSGIATVDFEPVALTTDPAGLEPGEYSAELTLEALEAENTPWHATVSLRIGELIIGRSPWVLTIEATVNEDPPGVKDIEIWSDDLGTIDWTVSCTAPWIRLDPLSGSSAGERDEVEVSIDHSGLPVGTYETEIIISAPGAANSPVSLPVSLTVGELVIGFSPDSLVFEAAAENDPPSPQTLFVRSEDTGILHWVVSCPAPWLYHNPRWGTSGGEYDEIFVAVDHQGLGFGDHLTAIKIEAAGAVNSPQFVPVVLTVIPMSIGYSPDSFTFQCDHLGEPPPDQILQVWNAGPGTMLWILSTDVNWLTFSEDYGYSSGDQDLVDVRIDQDGLIPGNYDATISISATGTDNSPQFVPVTLNVGDSNRVPRLVVGPGPWLDNPSLIRVYPPEQNAALVEEFVAYATPGYGANVSCGNLDSDFFEEILTGPGPGDVYGPHVRGFESDGTPLPGLSYMAYGTNKFGVKVAAGDLDGDGFDEIITGAGPGAVFGPHVRAFNYDGTPSVTPIPGVSFFAYGTPKWGVNVAAGDIDGDGYDEIITGPGPGAVYGPHVRGWNVDGDPATAIPDVSFLAYSTNQYGVNVTAGDVDGDGIDEIISGAGPGAVFGPHVRGWNYDGITVTPLPGFTFFAWYTPPLSHGVKVFAGADLNNDGRDELVAGRGPAPGADTEVQVFTYRSSTISILFSLEAYPNLNHGVNVAAGRF